MARDGTLGPASSLHFFLRGGAGGGALTPRAAGSAPDSEGGS